MITEQKLQVMVKELEKKVGYISYSYEELNERLWLEHEEEDLHFYSHVLMDLYIVELQQGEGEIQDINEHLLHFYEDVAKTLKKKLVFDYHAATVLAGLSPVVPFMEKKGYVQVVNNIDHYELKSPDFILRDDKEKLSKFEDIITEFQRYIGIMDFPLLSKYGRSINECLFYYFNEEQKFSLKEENGALFISVSKQKKELERLPLQKSEDVKHQIQHYFEKVRQKNKLKHVLTEEKYFLTEFCRSITGGFTKETIDYFYSLLQKMYNTIEIEELADAYIKEKKVNKKILPGGFVLFQFGDKLYLFNIDNHDIKEVQESEIERVLMKDYTKKINESFLNEPFKKEKLK